MLLADERRVLARVRILFVTQYGVLAASSRTRVFQYLPYLKELGAECRVLTVLPDITGSQLLVTSQSWRKLLYYVWASWRTFFCGLDAFWIARKSDLVLIQKVILPAPLRWLFAHCSTPLVYDFDDAIFTTEVRRQNWLASWKERRNSIGVPAMLRLCSLALLENDYTASFAARHCPRIDQITGPIDTDHYCPGPQKHRREVVLGWIGSASTSAYLDLVREPLKELARRLPQVRLCIVGAEQIEVQGIATEAKPWQIESEVEDLQNFDIGLMPMPDDPWTRGKGGYKLLQYMAVGLPVLTSPVGINQQIVEDGCQGFWARTSEEWLARLEELVIDGELRRRMGWEGRRRVEAVYALRVQQVRLGQLFQELIEGAE